MTIEEEECLIEASKVKWLKTKDEIATYAGALLAARKWGEKIDRENEKNKQRNRLTNRYNR